MNQKQESHRRESETLKSGIIQVLIGLFAVLTTLFSSPAEASEYWQLVFSYREDSLSLLRASRIPPVVKKVQTSGAEHSPLRIRYELLWLGDQGTRLLATDFDLPLGYRYLSSDGSGCKAFVPDEGICVVRVEGPYRRINPKPYG